MKVALLMSRFPVRSEGFLVDKVLGLLGAGVDVHVVVDEIDHDELRRVRDRTGTDLTDRIHRTPAGAPTRVRAAIATLRHPITAVRSLPRMPADRRLRHLAHDLPLFDLAPDVVHTEFAALAVGRSHLPRSLGCPLTTSVRGFDVAYAGLDDPDYYREVWPAVTRLHVLGTDLLEQARRRGAVDVPHTVIPPALDLAGIRAADPGGPVDRERPLRLLAVGRLHWKKAHHHAMAALRLVLDGGTPARLRIVGTGGELEHLAFVRHQLGLDDDVDLLGELGPEAVRAELADAQVFVHSAVTEGFSNAVLEAQAAGLPVVCTDAEGLAENVEAGSTALLVPRRDPSAMAGAIIELAEDPDRRTRLGGAGRRRAATRTIDQQIAAFVGFFTTAVETGPRLP